nr:hypothetical protein [uncultured Helicobacter sp.]
MIKVRLQGGLGNQMLQYAFARSLTHRGYQVGLDANWNYVSLSHFKAARKKLKNAANNGGGGKPTIKTLYALTPTLMLEILSWQD